VWFVLSTWVCMCVRTYACIILCLPPPSASWAKSLLVPLPPGAGHHAAMERLLQMNRAKISAVSLTPPEELLQSSGGTKETVGGQICFNHLGPRDSDRFTSGFLVGWFPVDLGSRLGFGGLHSA